MYPTKEEILKDPRPKFKQGLLIAISIWKQNYYKGWSNQNPDKQWESLNILATIICKHYNIKNVILSKKEEIDHYEPKSALITLKCNSILSLLHEIAHHIFGGNELTACRWSVWLYQLRFRRDYEKLIWQGHILVKPGSNYKMREISVSKEIQPAIIR